MTTITSGNRSVLIKAIDTRIDSGIRNLEYNILVGEQVISINHEELVKISEISISYIKPTELETSMEVAKDLIIHLTSLVERETKMQLLMSKHENK